MMKRQVLTIDQMKRLNELGVDTSIASMYWTYPVDPECRTRLTPVGEMGNLKSWEERGYGIGAFTLQDLLEIIPPRLEKKYMFLLYKVAPDYICEYSYSSCSNTLNTAPVGTVLDTVYEMLIWVVEHNYIQKKYLIK